MTPQTADTEKNSHPESTDERPTNSRSTAIVAAQIDIDPFDPVTQAIHQSLHGGQRIVYDRQDEVRTVTHFANFNDSWRSPSTPSQSSITETLAAAPDDAVTVIDKRVFTWLASGPVGMVDGTHDGLAWGIERVFGPQLRNGSAPSDRSLEAVPGIGETYARQIGPKIQHRLDELQRVLEGDDE